MNLCQGGRVPGDKPTLCLTASLGHSRGHDRATTRQPSASALPMVKTATLHLVALDAKYAVAIGSDS
jgi:hypothetical protein